ncbi:MAG: TetR/AcrR family transcriptional regulator, partial [Acidimicrobiales bacterium]|nr:TetR/AcrR family transcriptional regulator [Acidimicrobiales bacterium]
MTAQPTAEPTPKRSPGRPRNRPPDEQRAEIIVAARQVFAEHDYTGTTIELVARTAGVARPAVYEFFANKEELFVAVAEDAGRRIADYYAAGPGVTLGKDLRGYLRAVIGMLFDFIEEHP